MKETPKTDVKKGVSRRGFLRAVVPGLVAAGLVKAAGASREPANGTYGNGAYGGVTNPKTPS